MGEGKEERNTCEQHLRRLRFQTIEAGDRIEVSGLLAACMHLPSCSFADLKRAYVTWKVSRETCATTSKLLRFEN